MGYTLMVAFLSLVRFEDACPGMVSVRRRGATTAIYVRNSRIFGCKNTTK
jgi:hypothetical protein